MVDWDLNPLVRLQTLSTIQAANKLSHPCSVSPGVSNNPGEKSQVISGTVFCLLPLPALPLALTHQGLPVPDYNSSLCYIHSYAYALQ